MEQMTLFPLPYKYIIDASSIFSQKPDEPNRRRVFKGLWQKIDNYIEEQIIVTCSEIESEMYRQRPNSQTASRTDAQRRNQVRTHHMYRHRSTRCCVTAAPARNTQSAALSKLCLCTRFVSFSFFSLKVSILT